MCRKKCPTILHIAWYGIALSTFQLYGLIFLLGSFTVATLSDLKRMSAQRELLEI